MAAVFCSLKITRDPQLEPVIGTSKSERILRTFFRAVSEKLELGV
jgi:hypothetical protein